MTPWDPTARLAPGVTLVEASAGTGKTFGITSLVLRLVAEEGIPIDRILVVTYTRAATAELEDRIRSRLVSAIDALDRFDPSGDAVLARLVDHARRDSRVGLEQLARLRAAVQGFDQALVSTIHGFCQRMLQQNAFESRVAFDLELVTDTDPLLFEIVDDVLVRSAYGADPDEIAFLREQCGFTRDALRNLGRRALADPDTEVSPGDLDGSPGPSGDAGPVGQAERAARVRARFVRDLRRVFDERKVRDRVQTYQDLLRGLASRLQPSADASDRAALAAAIATGFDAALIDEFQDTDALQWTLFSACFGQGAHHLYLIGDPKQAIYGFRGANIEVYAAAARSAGDRRYTMSTNWRSDARLLTALNGVMDREAFFGPRAPFGYVPVSAAPRNLADRIGFSPGSAPCEGADAALQIRWIDPSLVGSVDGKPLGKGDVAAALPSRVAADLADLLADFTLADGATSRSVRPGDCAVLVRTGAQATAIQAALTAAGVPSVLTGAASVLASDEALAVQQWLEALASSGGGSASRVSASSALFGWTAEQLTALEGGEPDAVAGWERWLGCVARWRLRLLADGFTPALGEALDDEAVLPRLLGYADGERRVTNLLHVAELLDAVERQERLGLGALLGWLARRRADEELEADEVELRLDRDSDAVTILTMHKAKGLEFPVTFVPYLWDGALLRPGDAGALLVSHPADPTRRLLDVHPGGKNVRSESRIRAEREAHEEGLRLAYVAVTRAKHRCYLYTGYIRELATSPLGPFLHGAGPDRLAAGGARFERGAGALLADLRALAPHGVSVTLATPAGTAREAQPPAALPELAARRFTRGVLDAHWRRHSYTSMIRAAGHADPTPLARPTDALAPDEPGREGFDDDRLAGPSRERETEPARPLPARGPAGDTALPLASFPAGAEAGTCLHDIFEHAAFDQPEALAATVADRLAAHGFDAPRWAPTVTAGLAAVLETPLGGPLGERTLADLPRQSRLDELRFDLPLCGPATAPGEAIAGGAVSAALRSGDLPESWLASLDRLGSLRLAGFLTGSIDLVFQAPGETHRRWFVVDYKSNRLTESSGGDAGCVSAAFTRDGMQRELARHDYYLQYHLYLVALHRYLRWRLGSSYGYDRDIGGVYYLFVRGMTGPLTPRDEGAVRGSFFDRPSRHVIEALDAALGAR